MTTVFILQGLTLFLLDALTIWSCSFLWLWLQDVGGKHIVWVYLPYKIENMHFIHHVILGHKESNFHPSRSICSLSSWWSVSHYIDNPLVIMSIIASMQRNTYHDHNTPWSLCKGNNQHESLHSDTGQAKARIVERLVESITSVDEVAFLHQYKVQA